MTGKRRRPEPIWSPERAEEAFREAQTIFAVECPEVNLAALPGADDAFDDGVWFGIAGTLSVLHRHGVITLPGKGNPREIWGGSRD